jgi:hypothetical protein
LEISLGALGIVTRNGRAVLEAGEKRFVVCTSENYASVESGALF